MCLLPAGVKKGALISALLLLAAAQATMPLAVLLVLAGAEVQAARDAAPSPRSSVEGTELRAVRPAPRAANRHGGGAAASAHLVLSAYGNAGVVAAAALLGACLSHPAVAALPYLLALLRTLWAWRTGRAWSMRVPGVRSLQGYTGTCAPAFLCLSVLGRHGLAATQQHCQYFLGRLSEGLSRLTGENPL